MTDEELDSLEALANRIPTTVVLRPSTVLELVNEIRRLRANVGRIAEMEQRYDSATLDLARVVRERDECLPQGG